MKIKNIKFKTAIRDHIKKICPLSTLPACAVFVNCLEVEGLSYRKKDGAIFGDHSF